jgi:hypothetical protein
VVLYELLVGRRPFQGDTRADLLENVTSYEPRPPRQYDDNIPKELERICHKAIAKRATERYSTATDLADDLRQFLAEHTVIHSGTTPGGVASETHTPTPAPTSVGTAAASSASLGTGSSDSQPIKIVPKGLRSFDEHDADFFLELLPGPRDREGLTDSLRFWKTRIEETDPDNTFSVGLIYGPSGCGKSSLVKAGLLPRLSDDVIPVYIEATPEETETRLLHGLRKRCPALEDNLNLKETLAAHRYHQKAARAVLKALLPPSGTNIKGEMKSYDELLEASGYARRRKDFDDLIRILDSEIRLITPTDPEGVESDDDSVSHAEAGQKYFQLTHDYLVPPLRDWLTHKQKETRRGRAELRLAERSAAWNAKPEIRHLPSWWENLNIRLFTDKKKWTEPQRKMMGKAGRVHGIRSALVLVAMVGIIFGSITVRKVAQERQRDAEATRLVESLLQADTSQVKAIIGNLTGYREWAKDDLSKAFTESPAESNAKLHAALAMLPEDKSVLPFLKERLLRVSPIQFEHVRNLLEDHKSDIIGDYWQITKESQDPARRFQAACASASYDPANEHWQDKEFGEFVAAHLVGVFPTELLPWRNALRPVQEHLTASLAAIYRDDTKGEQVRGFATDTLADYLSDDAGGLFDLLADANQKQFAAIIGKLSAHQERAVELGNVEVSETPAQDASEDDKEALAMRQANAAVMLLRMNVAEKVWPLLKHSPDPRLRSYIIHWLSPRGVDSHTIINRYERETDVTIKRALLLCLGEFDLTETEQGPMIETLLTAYRTDPDAGLHAAAEWLLRQWDVTLPELPVGEPVLPDDKKQRLAKLFAEVEDIRQRLATYEQEELLVRQAAWERKLSERPALAASLSEGLVAHFPLDETEGKETANAVEGQTVGTYQGPGQPEWVPGIVGNALRLDSLGGHFNRGDAFSPERTDSFSYGCWFLSEKLRGSASLLAKMDDDNHSRGFDLWLQGRGVVGAHLTHQRFPGQERGHRVKVVSADPMAEGRWQHVMMTYDGSSTAEGVTIYVDGHVVGTITEANRLSETIQNDVPLHIGRRNKSFPFQGLIDDVRIYNRLLSKAEVEQLIQAGLQSLVGVPAEKRTPEQQALLAATYRFEYEQRLETQLAAAEAVLRTAMQEEDLEGMRRWYVNSQGQTFVILDAGEFQMGSPDSEAGHRPDERLHRRKIGRRFAISTKEVTRAQWRVFAKSQKEMSGRRIKSN